MIYAYVFCVLLQYHCRAEVQIAVKLNNNNNSVSENFLFL
jgi:hypothetical protein